MLFESKVSNSKFLKLTVPLIISFAFLFFVSCRENLKKGTADIKLEQISDALMPKPNQWLGHFGSNRNGMSSETNLNLDWFNSEPKRLWKIEIGTGVSGVSAYDDRLFSMGNMNDSDTVYCISAKDGSILWKYSYVCPLDKRMFEGGPAVTPLIDIKRNQLYTLSHEGSLNCIDIKTGNLKWETSYKSEVFKGRRPTWGFACSPLLYNEDLIVSPGGSQSAIAGLNPIDGSLKWSHGNSSVGYSSPITFTLSGSDYIAQLNSDSLALYNVEQNKIISSIDWRTKYGVNASIPLYSDGHILVTSGYGKGGALFKIDGHDLNLVYESKELTCQFQSPILVGGFVYAIVGDNDTKAKLVCMNLIDGKIMWTESLGGNRGNVISVQDSLIVLTERGEAITCKASPESFQEMGRFQAVGGRCWSPPTICNSKLFIRNNAGRLVCYNLKKN